MALTYCYEHGFPAAKFEATWRPSSVPNHMNVTYTVTEGGREFIRDVITTGLHTTRKSGVDKNMTLHAGDPLSPVEQTAIQQRFYNLGIFASVDTAIEDPDGAILHEATICNFRGSEPGMRWL